MEASACRTASVSVPSSARARRGRDPVRPQRGAGVLEPQVARSQKRPCRPRRRRPRRVPRRRAARTARRARRCRPRRRPRRATRRGRARARRGSRRAGSCWSRRARRVAAGRSGGGSLVDRLEAEGVAAVGERREDGRRRARLGRRAAQSELSRSASPAIVAQMPRSAVGELMRASTSASISASPRGRDEHRLELRRRDIVTVGQEVAEPRLRSGPCRSPPRPRSSARAPRGRRASPSPRRAGRRRLGRRRRRAGPPCRAPVSSSRS